MVAMSARTRTLVLIGLALFAVIATCLVVFFAGKEPSPAKPDRSERAEKPVIEDTPSPVGAINRSPSIVSSNADTGDATLRLPNIGNVEVKGSNEEAVLFQKGKRGQSVHMCRMDVVSNSAEKW